MRGSRGLDKLHVANDNILENYQAGKNDGNHLVQHADFTAEETEV